MQDCGFWFYIYVVLSTSDRRREKHHSQKCYIIQPEESDTAILISLLLSWGFFNRIDLREPFVLLEKSSEMVL